MFRDGDLWAKLPGSFPNEADTSSFIYNIPTILAKAFRGELVPTEAELARQEGRDYEPASVLLERIRAERAKQASSKPGKQRKPRQKTPKLPGLSEGAAPHPN